MHTIRKQAFMRFEGDLKGLNHKQKFGEITGEGGG